MASSMQSKSLTCARSRQMKPRGMAMPQSFVGDEATTDPSPWSQRAACMMRPQKRVCFRAPVALAGPNLQCESKLPWTCGEGGDVDCNLDDSCAGHAFPCSERAHSCLHAGKTWATLQTSGLGRQSKHCRRCCLGVTTGMCSTCRRVCRYSTV